MSRCLSEPIPEGIETARLHQAGFREWKDLYTPRQIRVISALLSEAKRLPVDRVIRQRLLVAVCGAAEMAGLLCRWDRWHPKPFEALANHRYSPMGVACEVNLLSPRGRGTIPRRLAHTVAAAEWMHRRGSASELATTVAIPQATVVCGTSERQRLRSGEVDLVLTDPPYFDDVQYGELAEVFLVWMRVAGVARGNERFAERHEAVANRVRGTTIVHFERMLTSILIETERALREGGRLILTFHNTDLRAWVALSAALRRAKLFVQTLAVVRSENRNDHSKRHRRAFSRDLVLECTRSHQRAKPRIAYHLLDQESQELLAAGMTLSRVGAGGYEEFRRRFFAELGGRPKWIRDRIDSSPWVGGAPSVS